MAPRDRTWKERLSLLAKRTALSLLASIATFLVWFVLPPPQRDPTLADYADVVRFDPRREGGHLLPELNIPMQGERIGQQIRFITNSKGFRNSREFPLEVPDGTCRILLLGDSYVDGMRTDQELTIGARLERALNCSPPLAECRNYEVMIAGSDNPANGWYLYQEHGRGYRPRLVILGITLGNDLTWHNYGGGMQPVRDADGHESLKWTGCLEPSPCGRNDVILPPQAYLQRTTVSKRASHYELKMRERLAGKARVFGDLPPPLIVPSAEGEEEVNACDYCVSLGLFYQPAMPEVDPMYADIQAVISGLNGQVTRNGAQLLVVIFPVRIQVSESDWRLMVRLYGLDASRFDLDRPNRLLSKFLRDSGIARVDLLGDFRAESNREHNLYRPRGDMHLNEEGNAVAAAGICAAVVDCLRSSR